MQIFFIHLFCINNNNYFIQKVKFKNIDFEKYQNHPKILRNNTEDMAAVSSVVANALT